MGAGDAGEANSNGDNLLCTPGGSKLGRTEKGKLLIPESGEGVVPLFLPCPDEGSLGEVLSRWWPLHQFLALCEGE